MVLLEAMAAGLPVVATRVGAIPEVVADGETGILVPPGDPDSLATGILHVLTRRKQAAAMGHAGRKRLLSAFPIERAVRAHEALYETLLCERLPRRPERSAPGGVQSSSRKA